jgi:hypothetical protein
MARTIANCLVGTTRRGIRIRLISTIVCAATAWCISCYGQTNQCPDKAVGFFLPQVQLRPENRIEEAVKPEPAVSAKPVAETPPQVTAADIVFDDDHIHARVVRADRFYLTRPVPVSDDPMVRAVNNIFTPEVVYLGKIPVTCSIVTAIKRKNPLCLLNPIFFQASW